MSTPVDVEPDFNLNALGKYLAEHIPDFPKEFHIRQFTAGQSNPTYQLIAGNSKYVLRKKPTGNILPSAHAVEREYRVMQALHNNIPVPKMLVLCTDRNVIGTEFFVMEMVDGSVSQDPGLPSLNPEQRKAFYHSFIETLAQLHSVDPESVGLADFGKPQGFLKRQVERWSKQYKASETETIEAFDNLLQWLP